MSRDVDKISAKLDLVLAEMALIKKTVNRLDRRGRTSRVKRATMPSGWVPRHDYIDEWNASAGRSMADVSKVPSLTPARANLLKLREQEHAFDWPRLLHAIEEISPQFVSDWGGFGFDWVISAPAPGKGEPYVRVIEGRYKMKEGERGAETLAGFYEDD